jgi:hypothetical protein
MMVTSPTTPVCEHGIRNHTCIIGFNGTASPVSTVAVRDLHEMIRPALPVFSGVVTHCGRSQSLHILSACGPGSVLIG